MAVIKSKDKVKSSSDLCTNENWKENRARFLEIQEEKKKRTIKGFLKDLYLKIKDLLP